MLIQLYLMLCIIAFLLFFAGFSICLMRGFLTSGKGVGVAIFVMCIIIFSMVAATSFQVEVAGCSTSCASTSFAYDGLAYLFGLFATLSFIMAIVTALLTFGEIAGN